MFKRYLLIITILLLSVTSSLLFSNPYENCLKKNGYIVRGLHLSEGVKFQNEYKFICSNSKLWGFINKKNNQLYKPVYSKVSHFMKGYALVMKEKAFYFIDKNERRIELHNYALFEQEQEAIVSKSSGTYLYSKPSINAKKVLKIPFKKIVKVLRSENTNNLLIIKNIRGYWLKISYGKYSGYVFSGYLAHLSDDEVEERVVIGDTDYCGYEKIKIFKNGNYHIKPQVCEGSVHNEYYLSYYSFDEIISFLESKFSDIKLNFPKNKEDLVNYTVYEDDNFVIEVKKINSQYTRILYGGGGD